MPNHSATDGLQLQHALDRMDQPTALYKDGEHAVYWLGVPEDTAFRSNIYLIRDGGHGLLVDPGSRHLFEQVYRRVAQIMPPDSLAGMIICHQDPDVAASMGQWLTVNPAMKVLTTPRNQVLLPHYDPPAYEFYDVEANPEYRLPSGRSLRFIPAPFLHFPGAFTTYHAAARLLFSGDIWAAIDLDWQLVVSSFAEHIPALDLFHTEYMASNLAARGFVQRLDGLPIDAILPQHGSLIGPAMVPEALEYLRQLRCGTDIIYAGLDQP
ncbi:MBL fold metallo-hydrolase [Desulfurivibrio alkaliphilus]|uniref:Beta-lactamase domain protein n=1 Tax=Desulfurivibrio alkaliphilus (strain DSM 19089 / UNIQEM U267 / AHT2) TaxID=589865 RepID=D6Z256_DESAT|nr:MBL fold metallo-hydrolase [Desulfurivibrio alkaliphilus]ADH85631.1 beta-lactamase domain protein [Desulfurivibrio alkaliphilus AHT 2]